MEPALRDFIKTTVNTRTKLDLLQYLHHNPYTVESLEGLAGRLHRPPSELENALQDLGLQNLVCASGHGETGSSPVFQYNSASGHADIISRLIDLYEGEGHNEVLGVINTEDVRQRYAELVQKRSLDDLKTRFVAMVSHELRTPLTVVKSILTMLQSKPELPQNQREEALGNAIRHCNRLGRALESLLLVSEMQNGRPLQVAPVSVNPRKLVGQVLDQLESPEETQRVRVSIDRPCKPITCDPEPVRRILWELLNNALVYSPPDRPVSLTVLREDASVVFIVEDQGVGLSDVELERVFDAFYKVERDAARLPGGIGLGLTVARYLVEVHGGRIWFEPKSPPGAKVCFTIPPAPATA